METATLGNLNRHQLEILKLFSRDLDDADLKNIKKIIVKYLAEKASDLADKTWESKGWTDADAEKMLVSEERTPYNSKNKAN